MTVTNGYCTLAQVRAHLGFMTEETQQDAQIEVAINAASRMIDGVCGWRFYQDGSVTAREFYPEGPRCVEFICGGEDGDEPRDGISTSTGLVVKVDYDGDGTYETTLTSGTDFLLMPRNAATRTPVWPYTEIELISSSVNWFPPSVYGRPTVQVTAKWGWPAVPDDITQAAIVQAALLFESRSAVFGAVALGESAARVLQSSLHPIAAALVAPYKLTAVG